MDTVRKLVAGGSIAAVALAGGAIGAGMFGTANAATGTPSPSAAAASSSTATEDAHPGDNGADGVPESQEVHGGHHGGHGGGLDLSGTVTAVGSASVTIKTSSATTTYTVTSSSDIDKNGEAALKDLAVGDAVTFSVDSSASTTIDKLHAGDESKDLPSGSGSGSGSADTPDAAAPSASTGA